MTQNGDDWKVRKIKGELILVLENTYLFIQLTLKNI